MPLASVLRVFSVRQQFFACMGLMSTPRTRTPVTPVSDDDIDTKFVVTIGDRGLKLNRASNNEAVDDMDGLHEIIGNQIVDQPVLGDESSPAERLASEIRRHEQRDSNLIIKPFFGFYDPVNDEWRDFEKEILGTDDVDDNGPKHHFDLRPTRVVYATVDDDTDDDDTYNDGELDYDPTVLVWSMSL